MLRFSRASTVHHRRANSRVWRVPDRVPAELGIYQREIFLPVLPGKRFSLSLGESIGGASHEDAGATGWTTTPPWQEWPPTALTKVPPAALRCAGPPSTKREGHRPGWLGRARAELCCLRVGDALSMPLISEATRVGGLTNLKTSGLKSSLSSSTGRSKYP